MRNLLEPEVNDFRDTSASVLEYYGNVGDSNSGAFWVPSFKDGKRMRVIASAGAGWEHVSVSRRDRVPNWYEMEYIKRLFFKPDEVAMQLHVPSQDHISIHPNCLHLWRPMDTEIPRPPAWMVG